MANGKFSESLNSNVSPLRYRSLLFCHGLIHEESIRIAVVPDNAIATHYFTITEILRGITMVLWHWRMFTNLMSDSSALGGLEYRWRNRMNKIRSFRPGRNQMKIENTSDCIRFSEWLHWKRFVWVGQRSGTIYEMEFTRIWWKLLETRPGHLNSLWLGHFEFETAFTN